jgi:hypothetical protein
MDWTFGRGKRRRYGKRPRPRKSKAVALCVALALALMIGVAHLAVAGPVRETDPPPSSSSAPAAFHAIRDQSPLVIAFVAAFGSPNGVLKRVGARNEPTWFTPGAIARAPFGPVLISEGSVVSPDADSTGKLAIVYLEHWPGGLRPRRKFIPAIESGSSGQIYDWRVRSDLGSYPVVEVEGHANWEGHACSWTRRLELVPAGPRELDDSGGEAKSQC